jgi:predicted RNase H-like HicB family nuclease
MRRAPGCHTEAPSLDELIAEIQKAIERYLETSDLAA